MHRAIQFDLLANLAGLRKTPPLLTKPGLEEREHRKGLLSVEAENSGLELVENFPGTGKTQELLLFLWLAATLPTAHSGMWQVRDFFHAFKHTRSPPEFTLQILLLLTALCF